VVEREADIALVVVVLTMSFLLHFQLLFIINFRKNSFYLYCKAKFDPREAIASDLGLA
jgi:hypothetical protein